ncbi:MULTISPECIES: AmpG family muropeptide MFS transporter [Spongiibacter]|uniref:AmpG family muropeptide MFS transporter n=1 Tax=Spongiibacter TaxID=630749 RepID=UPI000C6B48B8|nr:MULTISPECIES: AmpG family muropeptide MFS transporter [Spongiibacter]MAY38404.1 AmpG family muropeptide MFS transporter [Spongiibacter sp.]MBI59090.1 AmpG family muropeptide MFS transporter [Spongiibacter sp.]MBU72319.1 AmpG family muropeptide MFS transporter [Spongiibacter sp.]|tara:strand:+ start:797 stop:2068 length:1272 start_codon:yes stop_codon:yes gene_type:complete
MSDADTPLAEQPWHKAIFTRQMFICVLTGIASGLPLYFLIQLVPAWLRSEGVGLTEIGLFALVGFPYNWKFIWAPLMDRYVPPFLGRRRGWMLITQIALMLSMAALGFIDPKVSVGLVAYVAAGVAFFSASQDVVLDAYRRELLKDEELGLGNAIHVQAYRLAGLVPGSLGVIMGDYLPWSTVFMVMAGFMAIGVAMTLWVSEASDASVAPLTLRAAVVEPFREFVLRRGLGSALLLLSFLFLYKLGDNMATALSSPFYLDIGFSLTEIGTIAKTASLTAAIIGGLVGGVIMIRLGINRALWVFGFVQVASILGFAALAEIGPNRLALTLVIVFEYLGVGLGTAAFTAFIARATTPAYAATQFALFTALAALPRTFANATTGWIVEAIGWTNFYLFCTALAVPGMLMLFKVAPWSEPSDAQSS